MIDFLVIGGGIAGTSAAARLSALGSVTGRRQPARCRGAVVEARFDARSFRLFSPARHRSTHCVKVEAMCHSPFKAA